MEMVELPGGTFWMGSRDEDPAAFDSEKPRHRVEVAPFAIGRYAVTQAHFAAVMGENPGDPKGDAWPVNKVSWVDAANFCNRLSEQEGLQPAYIIQGEDVSWERQAEGYRLPTEAEWEYAARAGTETAWSFGDDEGQVGDHAWYAANASSRVHAVGEKKPNPWGLHDMHGNVWEWCWDWHGHYVTSRDQSVNPSGPPAGGGRVLRGGSWDLDPGWLRSAYRRRFRPAGRLRFVGFRCVRGLPLQRGG